MKALGAPAAAPPFSCPVPGPPTPLASDVRGRTVLRRTPGRRGSSETVRVDDQLGGKKPAQQDDRAASRSCIRGARRSAARARRAGSLPPNQTDRGRGPVYQCAQRTPPAASDGARPDQAIDVSGADGVVPTRRNAREWRPAAALAVAIAECEAVGDAAHRIRGTAYRPLLITTRYSGRAATGHPTIETSRDPGRSASR